MAIVIVAIITPPVMATNITVALILESSVVSVGKGYVILEPVVKRDSHC